MERMQGHARDSQTPMPPEEAARLEALDHYKLGGIGREAPFDRVTQLAADLFSVPIALVSIINAETQCFRGACGLDVGQHSA